ncbi:hypothetical protein ZWY2020_039091 [Hordeum vulgare]|nr:hypothetical protein ZWY2020_039091 [Hordeum vulgare]
MASGGDPGVFGEAGIGPEICRLHDWVPEGHKEKENFNVRLQIDVLEQAFGLRMAGAPSLAEPSLRNGISSQNSSVSAQRRGGSTSVGIGSRAPLEVEPDAYNSGVDEEKLYSDVIQNLRRALGLKTKMRLTMQSVWMMMWWVRTKTLQLLNGTL